MPLKEGGTSAPRSRLVHNVKVKARAAVPVRVDGKRVLGKLVVVQDVQVDVAAPVAMVVRVSGLGREGRRGPARTLFQ